MINSLVDGTFSRLQALVRSSRAARHMHVRVSLIRRPLYAEVRMRPRVGTMGSVVARICDYWQNALRAKSPSLWRFASAKYSGNVWRICKLWKSRLAR